MTDSPKNYQLICGLEVHAELKTKSKMFCGCKNDPFHAPKPNLYTCPTCLGMPGGLPVPNKKAIEWTIKLGLALNCKINLFSKFDRKHYFYPDLPKGYQISQYDIPFCYDGYMDTSEGRVGITRIHLEEDTGKLLHKTIKNEKVSLVDFNRGGVPLVEVVTEPDIKTAAQAAEYGRKLRKIIRYLDIGNCDMQKGGMRLEANISLNETSDLPEYKVEVKNINSFKYMEQAINYEMKRQAVLLNDDKIPTQETRGWDANKQVTFSQRTKESAEDYRYFPDPDIPPLQFTKEQIESWKKDLPSLPEQVISDWKEEFNIEERYSQLLIDNVQAKALLGSIFAAAQKENVKPNDIAKEIINKNIRFDKDSKSQEVIAAYQQLHQTDDLDSSVLTKTIGQVLAANQDAVTKYQAGKTQVIGFLLGQVAQKLPQKLDMSLVRSELLKALEN
ncbi:MAG: Asp-tRNA(Asn)/Glu-tRNA(Gln) amidotransferase subunit GatB [Candidatus Pacebacteria bacterium]|jgi:aspartyl-tRNA(Asn)/glutamyl-tRNA(Gln) amidotransferase subunit B|nr:Asp-tRNA(Asn)/Glu-tRNA(Gln) amidotransferase subunit GatB [Candidatus Paceibacterota bacterium]MBT4005209.1 Asp-tRNA(Asn)/Glu-tRNA(Gln) amidotransferase subunit GatB [Candidatus Paceibacterota bacterium]MBT4358581.1 Asp-tRNA(Asn)/Glu-tRNA(Gln) amidotransferase subunit GatB [Candidatus Paceibacterota bacterium]MBT4680668.1 Asp-tRNA(Asn)/Glu-tRNA(Gln) amidotransferase subunit GatB [Candidatus Paceibacterota bacterium]MBT6899040.1 Asp-tRNA(Asn)/Glu-tRNA(Gln) amidotransferase subunit GatB [Candi